MIVRQPEKYAVVMDQMIYSMVFFIWEKSKIMMVAYSKKNYA